MLESEEVTIRGENGDSVRIELTKVYGFPNTTSHWGGYEVQATADIVVGAFRARAAFTTSTGELYELFQDLGTCNAQLAGRACYSSFEHELTFEAQYDTLGHVTITGRFGCSGQTGTVLEFIMESDQTYIQATLAQLSRLAHKYGGMRGVGRV